MLTALRFLWNATKGNHLRPWRSAYLKWRIETYSGLKAESMTGRDMARFILGHKAELFRFLLWSGSLSGKTRRS